MLQLLSLDLVILANVGEHLQSHVSELEGMFMKSRIFSRKAEFKILKVKRLCSAYFIIGKQEGAS